MSHYRAPLRDMCFAMNEVLGFDTHNEQLSGDEVTTDLVDTILQQYANFCENSVAPLYRTGDEEGCHFDNGVVRTPAGFKEAFQQYVDAGWHSMSQNVDMGGQGLPSSLAYVLLEMTFTANTSFALYTLGYPGASDTIEQYGTPEQKDLYQRKIVEGCWVGSMCLTEPHCGTDLGLLRSRAEPQDDGSYALTGTKIFISGGEHDLCDNIIHIVLARLPGAPNGTKGISLFIVPKFLSDSDGVLGSRNTVKAGSIEQKMGIKASATCVMNFDGAKGFLLGEPHQGLKAMFTFMNVSRIGTAIQGQSHAELGFQKSLAYAKERLQMRSLTGPKNPDGAADPIIVHPDVRRMLLTQKAFAEGLRLLNYEMAKYVDLAELSEDAALRQSAKERLDFITPIAKAFCSETGFESANLAVQCFGGHGFIRETGVEQGVRDARIATLYEGTTGIQGLHLLSRKVLGSGGTVLADFTSEIEQFCEENKGVEAIENFTQSLNSLVNEWHELTQEIASKASDNADEIGAASVNYLMYSGYICLAYYWARSALVASQKLAEGSPESDFYQAKIDTTQFYFQHILPRTLICVASIKAGAGSMMAIHADHFQF